MTLMLLHLVVNSQVLPLITSYLSKFKEVV